MPGDRGPSGGPAIGGADTVEIVESLGAEADFDGVVWVDGVSKPAGDYRRTLSLDLGFFRVRLTGTLAATPLVFGCNWARVECHFVEAMLREKPEITSAPDAAKAKVEYGAESRSRVRFEAAPPTLILDGNAHIDYPLNLFLLTVVPGIEFNPWFGIIRTEPQWFRTRGRGSRRGRSSDDVRHREDTRFALPAKAERAAYAGGEGFPTVSV